jgi:tetratricopeptide (TPR) repeat protein
MQDGQYQAARDYAVRALGFDAGAPALLSARARAELALGNIRSAGEAARVALQKDPNDTNMVHLFAQAALGSRDRGLLAEACPLVESALGRAATDGNLLLLRTEILVALGRFEELKGISSTYVSAQVQDPAILLEAASKLAASDSEELRKEALKLFERAVSLSPASVEARLGLASTLYQTREAERAEKIYRDVLEQHPDNVRALNDLAWILQEHYQRYDKALELADKALALAPNDLSLLDTHGTILAKLPGRLTDARNDFTRLVDLSPPDSVRKAKALLQLGRVYIRLNDLQQAKQSVEKALQIHRKTPILTEAERTEIAEITSRTEI